MPTKVLVADANPAFQETLSRMLLPASEFDIVGWAKDGFELLDILPEEKPDVLIVDMLLPPQDGFLMVESIMKRHPLPIVLFSPMKAPADCELFREALSRGAQAAFVKPVDPDDVRMTGRKLRETVLRLGGMIPETLLIDYLGKKSRYAGDGAALAARRVIGIIGSTGAVESLRELLSSLQPDIQAAVAVAQHMYSPVWQGFAQVLGKALPCPMKMAEGGEIMREGRVLLSPTEKTLLFSRVYYGGVTRLESVVPSKGQIPLQPNLDVFFQSLAQCFGKGAVGIVLSGIGESGKDGARAIREQGGQVWVQDPQSAIASSMPLATLEAGLASHVLKVSEIGPMLANLFKAK